MEELEMADLEVLLKTNKSKQIKVNKGKRSDEI